MNKVVLFIIMIALVLPALFFTDRYIQKKYDAHYMNGYQDRTLKDLPPDISNLPPHKATKPIQIEKFKG